MLVINRGRPPGSWCNRRKSAAAHDATSELMHSAHRPARLAVFQPGSWVLSRCFRRCGARSTIGRLGGYDHFTHHFTAATACTSAVAPTAAAIATAIASAVATATMMAVMPPMTTTIVAAAVASAVRGCRFASAAISRERLQPAAGAVPVHSTPVGAASVMPVSAAATAKQPRVGLRLENHQDGEYGRHNQHHSNKISLHQKYLLGLTGNPIFTHTSVPPVLDRNSVCNTSSRC